MCISFRRVPGSMKSIVEQRRKTRDFIAHCFLITTVRKSSTKVCGRIPSPRRTGPIRAWCELCQADKTKGVFSATLENDRERGSSL